MHLLEEQYCLLEYLLMITFFDPNERGVNYCPDRHINLMENNSWIEKIERKIVIIVTSFFVTTPSLQFPLPVPLHPSASRPLPLPLQPLHRLPIL